MKTKQDLWNHVEIKKISKEDFEKIWIEKEKELSNLQQSPGDKEKSIMSKVYAEINKIINSKAETFEGVIIGFNEVTDFNALGKYNHAKQTWDKSTEQIRELLKQGGQYDELGNPIWSKENTTITWKYQNEDGTLKLPKQRRIDPEKEKQREILLIARKKEDKDYKVTKLVLLHDKINLPLKLGVNVEFRANGKFDNEGVLRLRSTSITQFNLLSEQEFSHEEVLDLVNVYFKNENIDFNDTIPSEGLKNPKRLVVITNATIARVTMTGSNSKNNVMNITSLLGNFDLKEEVTCWISKEKEIKVSEGDSRVVIFGTPLRKSENLALNVLGIFNPFVNVKPLPIETKVEKSENDEQEW